MTTTKQIRVMIVDDHAIVRDGLQLVLEQAGDMTVVGQAVDGEEALRVAREVEPDVVVMDLIMPNKDGVEACSEIMQTLPQTQVLVLTASTADDAIMNALAAGATGYLQKYSGRDDLLTAVRDAAAGRSQIPVDMVRRALESVREAPARGDDAPGRCADGPRTGSAQALRGGKLVRAGRGSHWKQSHHGEKHDLPDRAETRRDNQAGDRRLGGETRSAGRGCRARLSCSEFVSLSRARSWASLASVA